MSDKDNKNEEKSLEKSEKSKKAKKEKKSSSFFSNLNSNSTIEYGLVETNKKSKAAKWTIAGLLAATTVVGVAVPWSLSSCAISIKKPYADSNVMYTYIDNITGKEVAVTYAEFEERVQNVQSSNSILEQWDDIFYESTLKQMYNEERDAFLKFQAIYKKIHGSNPTISNFGADLTTKFDDIKKQQESILNENKKTFQKATNSSESWLDLWIKELQTNSIYGPQSTNENSRNVVVLEQKALAYMVNSQIKEASLARYRGASITTGSWKFEDFNFANKINPSSSGEYVSYTNNNGDKQTLTEQEAVNVWKAYLVKNQNVVQPKTITDQNNSKLAVFETKSYLIDYRNPIANGKLTSTITKNYKLGLVSSFEITGITPGSSNVSPFTITSDVLKSLFKAQNPNSSNATANFIPFSRLSNFQGANLVNTSTNENDSNYISNFKDDLLVKTFVTDEATNSLLGSSKLVESSSLLTTTSSDSDTSSTTLNVFGLAALSSSSTGATSSTENNNSLFSINSTNPFTEFMKILLSLADSQNNEINLDNNSTNGNSNFKNNWQKLEYGNSFSNNLKIFATFLKTNLKTDTFEFNNSSLNANEFNNQLENNISALSSDDLNFLGQIFNCILIGDSNKIKVNYEGNNVYNQVGYWTLYQLSGGNSNGTYDGTTQTTNPQTYMYVSSTGIKIFSKQFNNPTLQDFQNMVLSDLNQTINVEADKSPVLYYDIASVFSKLNNDNMIILSLLDQTTNNNSGSTDNTSESNQKLFKDNIKKYLKDENPSYTEDKLNSESEKIYSSFYEEAKLSFNQANSEAIGNIISTIPSSLKTLMDSARIYDFGTILDEQSGEKLSVFQTQNSYNGSSVAKGQDNINDLFIETIFQLLTITNVNNNSRNINLKKVRG